MISPEGMRGKGIGFADWPAVVPADGNPIAPMAVPRYPIDLGAPICPLEPRRLRSASPGRIEGM